MLTTIENPVKKAPEKKERKAKKETVALSHEEKTRGIVPVLSTSLVFIILALILIMSYTNGMLFFKELTVSSIIIVGLMSLKLMDYKKA